MRRIKVTGNWFAICGSLSNNRTTMARKSDPQIQENIDRGEENGQDSAGIDSPNNNNDEQVSNESDTIKNANAAGLGAMGRNDQKQAGYTSNHSVEGGSE